MNVKLSRYKFKFQSLESLLILLIILIILYISSKRACVLCLTNKSKEKYCLNTTMRFRENYMLKHILEKNR